MQFLIANLEALMVIQLVASIAFYTCGVFGLAVAILTLRSNRQNQRESNARRAYLDYARFATDRPDLSFPTARDSTLDGKHAASSSDNFEQYEWFVSIVLATVMFLVESSPRRGMWRRMAILQLAYHWPYLEKFQHQKEYLKIWRDELSSQIAEGIAIEKSKYPNMVCFRSQNDLNHSDGS